MHSAVHSGSVTVSYQDDDSGFRLAEDVLEDTGIRVIRGGSWFDLPYDLRSADRYWFSVGSRNIGYGFRLVEEKS